MRPRQRKSALQLYCDMNAAQDTLSPRPWIRRLALPLGLVLALSLLLYGVTSFFRLSRDARCLRNSLTGATEAQSVSLTKRLELSIGALSFGAFRAGLSLVPLQQEVRAALGAMRGAEVGLYDLGASWTELDRGIILEAADRAMAARGWDRLVGVTKARELVAVYIPRAHG